MLDVKSRDGLSRLGHWTIMEKCIEIPTIAGISTNRIPLFTSTELEVSYLQDSSLQKLEAGNSADRAHLDGVNHPHMNAQTNHTKLHLYHLGNPLLKESMEKIDIDKPVHPNLFIPGTINFPECFTEVGISKDSLFPVGQNKSNEGSKELQIITDSTGSLDQDAKILIIANAVRLLDNPRGFVSRIVSLNHRKEPQKLLYLPGIATVHNLAVLVYLGVDIVDTCQCVLQARIGNLMNASGPIPISAVADAGKLCGCDGCANLREGNSTFEGILKHNENALFSELALIKSTIARGRLRELVEQRMLTEPRLSAIVRILDLEFYDTLEQYSPVFRPTKYITCSREALNRIEVIRFRTRVKERYIKPDSARILLLLPCSAKKPYSTSKSHRLFRQTIQETLGNISYMNRLHEVIVTSPLGLVPRELELVYPAQQYDIPVTGHWFADEREMIKECIQNFLIKNKYDHILIHFNSSLGELLKECVQTTLSNTGEDNDNTTPVICTSLGHPTAYKSLEKLANELRNALTRAEGNHRVSQENRQLENLGCISRYQFGEPGVELLKGSKIKGRYPNLKIFKDSQQVGMLTGVRGFISLTLHGARILAKKAGFQYKITIDDFVPKGSIMAVGVEKADNMIRIGDEVVACHNDEVRAVGQAVMSGVEMQNSTRGMAVKVRHHI